MRKLLIISIVLIFSLSIYSQENDKKNPNVELPDFVITGKDVISLQKANKLDPGFISIISEEFIQPLYSPENLGISDLANPIKDQLNLTDTLNLYSTRLTIGTGIYASPEGNLSFAQPFNNVIIGAVLNGENQRAYIDNSDRYKINGELSLAYFVPDDASLSGTQFKFRGGYGLNSYRFYASNNPTQKRNYYNGNYSLDVSNLVARYFNFDLSAKDKYTFLSDENLTENLFRVDGYLKGSFPFFNLAGNFNYTRQLLTNNIINKGDFDYIFVRPYIQFILQNAFIISGGISYSKSGSLNYTAPYASVAFKVNDFVSLYGEFNPSAEFLGQGDFLVQNMYYNPQVFPNAFIKKTSAFTGSLKFQYFKYYEIDAGIKYFKADNLPFFMNSASSGMFDVNFTGATNYSVYANFLFHNGPYGVFYATADYNDLKDNSGNTIPYSPKMKTTVAYGYNFDFGFSVQPKLDFYSQSYADLDNLIKLDPYIDLGVKIAYKFGSNFSLNVELSNLVDRKNYKWYGYREAPLDLVAGFTYKW